MSEFTTDDQWRSFQTFLAVYVAGMLHPRDVMTISRKSAVMPPLVEFRCDDTGRLLFGIGALSWSDETDATVQVSRQEPNKIAKQTVDLLRDVPDVQDPSHLRLSGSGPASSVAVLDRSGFMSGGSEEVRKAVLEARRSADIDVEGDNINAEARLAGARAFEGTRSGSIAAIAFAAALARLRCWVDPFSSTPQSGFQVGGYSPEDLE